MGDDGSFGSIQGKASAFICNTRDNKAELELDLLQAREKECGITEGVEARHPESGEVKGHAAPGRHMRPLPQQRTHSARRSGSGLQVPQQAQSSPTGTQLPQRAPAFWGNSFFFLSLFLCVCV